MSRRAGGRALLLAALILLSACGSSHHAPAGPVAPKGDLSRAQLAALLLQPADVAGLPQRRTFASTSLTTQTSPQLVLCDAPSADAPHELSNVIMESSKVGVAKVFEIVSVYRDGPAAQAAYDRAQAQTRRCQTRPAGFQLLSLAPVAVAGARGFHYRISTPDVVGGDVRTYAQRGRFTVLLTGYGAPPTGQSLLDYQLVLVKAGLARLP